MTTAIRDKTMVKLYGEGKTQTELGKTFGLSQQRVSDIVGKTGVRAMRPAYATPWTAKRVRAAYIAYLYAKIAEADWHAARDMCVDIEVLDARHGRH